MQCLHGKGHPTPNQHALMGGVESQLHLVRVPLFVGDAENQDLPLLIK